jgi:hypothetical protein
MQNNYNALYEYICDNPVYNKKSITVSAVPVLSPLLSLLKTDNFWQEQDAFWKAVVANIDDNV